jgi:hypothetical protein
MQSVHLNDFGTKFLNIFLFESDNLSLNRSIGKDHSGEAQKDVLVKNIFFFLAQVISFFKQNRLKIV